ncbi:UDP-GlcNAc:undecaprenyl-phosphate GlcNAc-1-phosphate transferase [Elusimicrobium posterum]|uniref:MraY family glycosyltransferase n=1 Tax=Elusimicrobium posterum TaxID=3116653 RepID=UPI003C75A931
MQNLELYVLASLTACALSSVLVPFLIHFTGRFLGDAPFGIKSHTGTVPLVGGSAVMAGLCASLILIRFITNFPTGTLHSLRGILIGGAIIYITGLIDDLKKPQGLGVIPKLILQFAAAYALYHFDIRIKFLGEGPAGMLLTMLWVVGITNAFNLLDIMDGLCCSQALCAALFFLVIALPGEHIYVNFASAAIAGAVAGFWPYNHKNDGRKAFLGDSGSLLLGFMLAAIAMGTEYSQLKPLSVYAPLLILALPIFDTCFVMLIRILQKKNPFKGSPDHIVMRLEKLGLTKNQILMLMLIASICYGALALLTMHLSSFWTIIIFGLCAADMALAAYYIGRVKV